MTEEASAEGVRNECGQRAAAKVLSRRLGGPAREHYARLRESHPPDTPLRLLGTTPRRVAQMLSASGVPATVATSCAPSALRADAIACVDLRPLAGGLPRLHWMAIDGVCAEGVHAEGRLHDRPRWMRAWSCRVSPFAMHRRALILVP